ncbi:hypothetical protein J3E69DRAFT_109380 [Trichoderma sp. SZMC 28015]
MTVPLIVLLLPCLVLAMSSMKFVLRYSVVRQRQAAVWSIRGRKACLLEYMDIPHHSCCSLQQDGQIWKICLPRKVKVHPEAAMNLDEKGPRGRLSRSQEGYPSQ